MMNSSTGTHTTPEGLQMTPHATVPGSSSSFRRAFALLAVIGVSFSLLACGESQEGARSEAPSSGTPEARNSIVEIARVAGQFSTLLTAVEAAGLTETLQNDGPFTVFAPTDGAFANLPDGVVESLLADPEALAQILLYHVVPGALTVRELRDMAGVETAQGDDLTLEVTPQGLTINGAYLLTENIRASNGIVHVITSVLVPGSN
jgi:uncharacterized surface protein with fasciclin (FAS1) repeats